MSDRYSNIQDNPPSPPSNPDHLFSLARAPSITTSNHPSIETTYDGPKTNLRSCITCRRRKVRCDKESPCSNCSRNGTTCIFPPPGRARPKPRGSQSGARVPSINRKRQGAQDVPIALNSQDNRPKSHGERSRPQGHPVRANRASSMPPKARPIRGLDESASGKELWVERCLYFGERPSGLLYHFGKLPDASRDNEGDFFAICYANLTRLLEEPPDSLPDGSEDEDDDMVSDNDDSHSPDLLLETAPSNQEPDGLILGCSNPQNSPNGRHLSPSEIPFFWQTFVENVDPLIKIFHIPSMNKTIREIQCNTQSLSPSENALMLAICFAAATSMTPDEAQEFLGQEKDTLVAQFRFATRVSLDRANFMSSLDLMTLQAAVLFVYCVHEGDLSRFSWTMTAVIVRIAQGLGIHRVHRGTDLSPYDTEISLRLWLSIWLLDLRTALDQGTEALIPEAPSGMELPLNINDSDLDPSCVEYPPAKTGMTDMAPTLVKYKTGSLMKKMGQIHRGPDHEHRSPILDPEIMEQMAAACRGEVQDEYMQNCHDDDNSFQRFTVLCTRLFFSKLPLLIYHPVLLSNPRLSLSLATRGRLLGASTEMIECSYELITNWVWPSSARQPCTHIHWLAISTIIEQLFLHPRDSDDTQKARNAIDLAIGCWGSSSPQQDELWKPLMRLMKRAKNKCRIDESLTLQEPLGVDYDLGGDPMPVDWTSLDSDVPLSWSTEFSAACLGDDVAQDFLGSIGSPGEIFDLQT